MANQVSSSRFTPVLWCVVFILVMIGVASTINRSLFLRNGVLFFDPLRPTLSASVIRDLDRYDNEFANHALPTFLHIVAGSIFLILAPLQFSSRIRNRYIAFHRWSGRFILIIAILATLFGLFLSVPFRFTGIAAFSGVIVFGGLFLFALIRAYAAIRDHDTVRHREWMIRAFSIGIGIATVRIVGAAMILTSERPTFELLGLSFWIGWLLTLAAGEYWIRRTRNQKIVDEVNYFHVPVDRNTTKTT